MGEERTSEKVRHFPINWGTPAHIREQREKLNALADEVAALEQERATNEELIARYRADLDESIAVEARLREAIAEIERFADPPTGDSSRTVQARLTIIRDTARAALKGDEVT